VTSLSPKLRAVLAALAVLLASAAAAAGPNLADVRIEGNRRVEVDAIRAAISEKKGEPLDPVKVEADIRAVMKLGLFDDVVAELAGPASAPVLVYRVAERPTVREVRTTGNGKLSKDDLKDTVELKPFSVLDLSTVQKDVKKIQAKYVEKGYFLADVSWKLEPLPDNQVDVVYLVNERAKVQVKEVRFLGNSHLAKDDIAPYMQTREGTLLSALNSTGTYKQEAFDRDLQAVQAVYMDHGFVNVRVGTPSVALSPDKSFIFITIPVEEGEQFHIGKVSFSGQLLDQKPRLEGIVQTRPGDLFVRSKLGADLFAVGDVFKDLGYAYANVVPLTTNDPDKRLLDLEFDVQPGPKVYFERIDVVGNDKTRDKVVRRELRFAEGDLYSATRLKVSKSRVNALGFFETVEITTKKGSAEDKIVATVEVKERATGTFQIGAGFSSYENFILTGQVSQNNFFGWGQTLSVQVQWSSIRQLGQLQFVEPYFLDTRWTFAFDLYATEGFYTNFTRRAIGGSTTWGYELVGLQDVWPFARHLEDFRLFGTYTNERINVTAASSQILLANQFKAGTTSSVRLSLQWDKRDNRLFPTAGFFTSASAEFAPPFLAPGKFFGNEVNLFTRYAVDARFYRPLFLGIVFRTKLTLGWIKDWDANHQVPISELFYVGGINSVRGYQFLSIAPTTSVGCNGQRPDSSTCELSTGGDKQAVVNLELEFPLFDKVGVRGVLFADAGNAFPKGMFYDPAVAWSLYKSVGFGFRWFSPIGPLRFEWGVPLDRRKNAQGVYIDKSLDFQFTIGNFF
jgi:outer membrane protein insertion porin family